MILTIDMTHTANSLKPAPVSVAMPRPVVLVVDDEEGVRASLQLVLQKDYEVLLAGNGAQALALAAQQPVHAAILDLQMEGMSGLEVFQKLRAIDPFTEIIILTAHATLESARQAVRLGGFDYLSKPSELAPIRAVVAEAVARQAWNRHRDVLEEELQDQRFQQESLRTKNQIYAAILHDVSNPLTFIATATQLLSERLSRRLALTGDELEFAKDRLALVSRHALHCVDICQRYLSYTGEHHETPVAVKVRQVLTDVEQLLRCYPEARGHELVVAPAPEDLTVRANGLDMMQILLNLVMNALQCSADPHRVEVSARRLTEPLTVDRFQERRGERFLGGTGFQHDAPLVALVVRDNGPGIVPDVLPRIFEPYFTTKPSTHGTGLGLAIVQRCVNENHGAIRVRSEVGTGTTVTVFLPDALNLPTASTCIKFA